MLSKLFEWQITMYYYRILIAIYREFQKKIHSLINQQTVRLYIIDTNIISIE